MREEGTIINEITKTPALPYKLFIWEYPFELMETGTVMSLITVPMVVARSRVVLLS